MRLATLLLALTLTGGGALIAGCDHEISSRESTKTKSDGTVEKKKETVTEKPDGSVVKEEKKEVSR